MVFRDWPIRSKLTAITMLTSITVLVLTATALTVYELASHRANLARTVESRALILAEHSAPALGTHDPHAAALILAALRADPHLEQAALYDLQGRLLAQYPAGSNSAAVPAQPGLPGTRFEDGGVVCFEPVLENGIPRGTFYLKSDMDLVYVRVRIFILIALAVLCGAVLVAWALSQVLQQRICQPILALARTARLIAQRADFSLRAPKHGADELGELTEAFNQMVAHVQGSEQSSSLLSAIVQSTDAAIIGKDLTGKVLSWNPGAGRMFGYSAAEMVGQPITRLLRPAEGRDEEERILEAVKRGQVQHYETVRVCKDGRPLEVSLIVSPIKDARGAIIGVSSIARDITRFKQAQRELQESRARFSGIISSAMDAIISVDGQQCITLFNAAAEQMFRCPAAQALGQPLDRFIPLPHREAHREHVEEFGRNHTTARSLGRLSPLTALRADGEEFPMEASISSVEVAGEKIHTVIVRDITERQQAQQALERQARALREQAALLDLANVLARDLEDRIVLWSSGMEKLYGWSRPEALGHVSHALLHTEFPEPLEALRAQLLRAGEWSGELVHHRKDGTLLNVASHWVLHKDEQGQPVAILEVNTDITARKRAEEQIQLLNLDLERRVEKRTIELSAANKELEAFTYSVAHDLRAPLRHIDAFSRIVHEEYSAALAPEAVQLLENIRKGSRHMSQLVDDLLNLARVGRQELKRRPTDLNQLVNEVVADLHHELQGRNVEWRLHPLPTIPCDAGLMKQVFANLLSNAVKYTRPRAQAIIEVGCLPLNGDSALYVRDNGVGFNMKYVDKLFGVFQRLHRSDEFEGTGVGLATVERIIRKHGGCVWAEGAVDKGAVFYISMAGLEKSAATAAS